MFMNEGQIELNGADWQTDKQFVADARIEATAYQDLLNIVAAARAGLVSGEHDYDYHEDELL